jgi:hypothetical protein
MRRLPHQGDTSNSVFLLLHLWVLPSSWAILFPNDLPPLSLACGWPLGANDSLSCEWRRLHELRVEGSSGARKGGPNRPPKWARPAGLGRPAQTQLGSVRSPLRSVVLMYLCTLPPLFALFWRCHPRVQDGGSPCMKSGLSRFNPRGCSFVTLRSLPPFKWFHQAHKHEQDSLTPLKLVVNSFFMPMFPYINITLPDAHTKMNLLYD